MIAMKGVGRYADKKTGKPKEGLPVFTYIIPYD
jgi:hypothetical protein